MRCLTLLVAATVLGWSHTPLFAAEGSSIAGPIGGNDLRSAQLPPPGIYGGLLFLHANARKFYDGQGRPVPSLDFLHLTRNRSGPFLLYVPEYEILGGSVGFFGFVPAGTECGRLFEFTAKRCISGIGDPYVELVWSRFLGTMRPSKFPGAYPIAEGLTVSLGLGVVIPAGKYDTSDATSHGLTIGNNVWDIAPAAAFTYVTKPIFADGTGISAKLYWNNYVENPDTKYATGSIISVDFAVSERMGRWQAGLTGVYAVQVADDKQFGTRIEPDGRRGEALGLGGVIAYDLPEFSASMKLKVLATVKARNTVRSRTVSFGWLKKF